MAVPWFGHLRARLDARLHVQVRLAGLPNVVVTPALVPVAGHVVRVFRGEPTVRVGDAVQFPLPVHRPGDEIWPGPSFMRYDDLMQATHLEAYLNGDPPACELALDECIIIDGPTYFARLRASRLSYLAARLWWRFR